jgi:hypothetical protein
MTVRRQDSAACRRGEFNRDPGSRRLSRAVDAQRRLNARRADDARTRAYSVGPSDPRHAYPPRSYDWQGLPMPQFVCLACKTRMHSAASEADPIGDLCSGVRVRSWSRVGELGEIGGAARSRHAAARRTVGASRAGQLIAGRVGRDHRLTRAPARTNAARNRTLCANSVSPQVQALSTRAPGTGDEAVRRRRRALTPAVPPRLSPVVQAFDAGRHRRERRRQTKVRTSPSAAGHAPT